MIQTVDRPIKADEIRGLVGAAPVIVEIGCHEGTDTLKFLEAIPSATLFCFEPDVRAAGRFLQAVGHDSRVTFYQQAVADVDSQRWFWASTGPAGDREDWDCSGSIRRPTGHLTRSPEIRFKDPVMVDCVRLDSWYVQRGVEAIDFMWCDVQGAQRDVISGGPRALQATRYLYIECHRRPLYDGEPTQEELIELLPGFVLVANYDGDNLLFRNRREPWTE